MKYLLTLFSLLIIVSCNHKTDKRANINITNPNFNADSAYNYIERQVNFGPRVPNTKNHVLCGDYLISELTRFGASVIVQDTFVVAYNKDHLNIRNIIGQYNTENRERVLLFAHWDTRPYADWDLDINLRKVPILGADDGASGVGVLLEVARQINLNNINVGIDIIFFDAEDYGPPSYFNNPPKGEWWCLGSQYWAKNPHKKNYHAKYGILLDMVGSKNAIFYKEGVSMYYAASVVEKIWTNARALGMGSYFKDIRHGNMIDDHLYVNTIALIPSVDIINTDTTTVHGFGKHWHSHQDNMGIININTLEAVGNTIMKTISEIK